MNVTYMFRATNREARGLVVADASSDQGKLPSDLVDDLAVDRSDDRTAPLDAETEAPASAKVAAPLVLGDRIDAPQAAPSPDPAPATRTISSALPGSVGLPARYVATEGRIILVAKARGGIGATTLAVNLALEMQLQSMRRSGVVGGRVALIDLDVQLGNAGSLLDLADRGGMLALARLGPEPDAQAVRHAMVRHPSGLSILAAPSTAIPFEAFDVIRVASMLDALAAEHDVVIVDLPPALIDWLEPLLARAERLLMVSDLAVPSVVRARRIINLMTEDHPQLPVEIVVAHEKKPFRFGQTHRDAEAALGHPLRHWLPDEAKLARQALDRGEPLVQLAPRSAWSKAVKTMAADLLTPIKNNGGITPRGDY
jgi:Flp pilus assembly CpaE family ATPase